MANALAAVKTAGISVLQFGKAHLPEILTGGGVGSMIGGTITAIKVQPKIQADREQYKDDEKELKKQIVIDYIPTILLEGTGVILIGTGMYLKNKQVAALGAAAAVSANALKSYKNEIKALVGDEKTKEIDKKVAKDVKESANKMVAVNNDGMYLCIDGITGQIFWSNEDKIKAVYHWVNMRVAEDTYCSVNDYLCELELNEVCDGNGRGWYNEIPGYPGKVHPRFDTTICDTYPFAGHPAIIVKPTVEPKDF